VHSSTWVKIRPPTFSAKLPKALQSNKNHKTITKNEKNRAKMHKVPKTALNGWVGQLLSGFEHLEPNIS
jgi:hypothetical protein